MIKNTLLKCAMLIGRDDLYDLINSTNSVEEIENKSAQTDVIKLINYYNFITNLVCENYLSLTRKDYFVSNADRKIFFNNFLFKPLKIISANSAGTNEYFNVYADHILVKNANQRYEIEYKFSVDEVSDYCKEEPINLAVSEDVLSMGIAAQFLASKGKFNESEFWNDKFLYKLFKYKCGKERRLKPHFKI